VKAGGSWGRAGGEAAAAAPWRSRARSSCTSTRRGPSLANEIKEALEGSDNERKQEAMKKAIMLLLNNEQIPQLFITIVRYVLPSEDHTVQKLLLLYLEIIEKTDAAGKILPEMILICQNLQQPAAPQRVHPGSHTSLPVPPAGTGRVSSQFTG